MFNPMYLTRSQWFVFLCAILLMPLAAAEAPISTGFLSNVAAGGHDVTAYHQLAEEDKAIRGKKTYTVKWKGVEWQFVSQADSEKFSAEPEKFTPAYGGHCANALSLGEGLIRTNGRYWAIFDNQLYLFYAPRGAARWKAASDYREYKAEADQAWQDIIAKR